VGVRPPEQTLIRCTYYQLGRRNRLRISTLDGPSVKPSGLPVVASAISSIGRSPVGHGSGARHVLLCHPLG